jgi:hypothetical protein
MTEGKTVQNNFPAAAGAAAPAGFVSSLVACVKSSRIDCSGVNDDFSGSLGVERQMLGQRNKEHKRATPDRNRLFLFNRAAKGIIVFLD